MHSIEPQSSGNRDTDSLYWSLIPRKLLLQIWEHKEWERQFQTREDRFLISPVLRKGILSSLQEVLGKGDLFGYITFLVLIKSLGTPESHSSRGASRIRAPATITTSPLTLKHLGLLRKGHSPDQTCQIDLIQF